MNETLSNTQERVLRLFTYLQALEQLRNPVVRELGRHAWFLRVRDLPEHECIEFRPWIDGGMHEGGEDDLSIKGEGDFILRSRRPYVPDAPAPPKVLDGWLTEPLDDPEAEPERIPWKEVLNHEGDTVRRSFDEDAQRRDAWTSYRARWEEWRRTASSATMARRVFEKLYGLFGRLEREGDRLELVVGDGLLRWRHNQLGSIEHPILLQRVQLKFDPEIPEFTITEADYDVEFYTSLLRLLPEVDGHTLAVLRGTMEQGLLHPLEGDETANFFRRVIGRLSPRGEFFEEPVADPPSDNPVICRDPVFFLRTRSGGIAQAIESIVEVVKQGQRESPASLRRIVGIESEPSEDTQEGDESIRSISSPEDVPDVLYSKAANPEQVQIAKKLEARDSVIVQGPPGTGKSHTIANLLGHLLAQGMSVLVTSHSTKALRVLRELVEEPLRGLCVSVLDRDDDSRHELQTSIQEIVHRLSSSSRGEFEKRAEELYETRARLITKLTALKREAFEARRAEYEEIVIGADAWTPSEAARKISSERSHNAWIPGPVERGYPLPLSIEEIQALYRTNVDLPEEDESDLQQKLPRIDDLLQPAEFRELTAEYRSVLEKLQSDDWNRYWSRAPVLDEARLYEDLALKHRDIGSVFSEGLPTWICDVLQSGLEGGAAYTSWQDLAELITHVVRLKAEARGQNYRWNIVLGSQAPTREDSSICCEIQRFLNDRKLHPLQLLLRPRWKSFVRRVKIDGQPPSKAEHFEALAVVIDEAIASAELRVRWLRQMVPLGLPALDEIGNSLPEYAQTIERSLRWQKEEWEPYIMQVSDAGLDYARMLRDQQLTNQDYAQMRQLHAVATSGGPLQLSLEWRCAQLRAKQSMLILEALQETLKANSDWREHPLTEQLIRSVSELEPESYEGAFLRALALQRQAEVLDRRNQLLDRLREVAPGWAQAIEKRESIHGQGTPPSDPVSAWTWTQLRDELDRRSRLDSEKLPRKIEKTSEELRGCTSALIEALAWEAQLRRTNLEQQQALVGFSDILRKIGKGTGKRAPRLYHQARQMTQKCRTAVPVWIMPFAKVVEAFNPRRTQFDVAIIDEASQMDVTGLIVFFMARKVIVVGDHEQVSPLAVGQAVEDVDRLITEHLDGIPNAVLYDGKTSIYDLARQCFEGLTMLREHFRCVPPIIEFSNRLCYNGKILPLRDTSKVSRRPFMIEKRVDKGFAVNKINAREAEFTAALIAAAIEQPEYEGATMGVITLVGEGQAIEIESILRRKLEPRILERHRVLCGNAAQFQGDERDVMFLSMVDSPRDGPLPLRERELFRQRYNVAVSRAKDQLWLVHSLDPGIDLKPRDLRRRLIEHIRGTRELLSEFGTNSTESHLETSVMQFLVTRNYKVTPQVQVGAYRIDMVVEGEQARLAVECDGDRYHTIDRLRDDMERQAVLERLGWCFMRVRGSQFYQDSESTMRSVLEELDALGIYPIEDGKDAYESGVAVEELKDRVIRRAYEFLLEWRLDTPSDEYLEESSAILTAQMEDASPRPKVTEEEARYLRQPFVPACSHIVFSPDEWYELKRYGSYMTALAAGDLKPRTDSQKRFLAVFGEGREPTEKYEKLWWRYLARCEWESDPNNRNAMGPPRTLEDNPVGSRDDFEKLHASDKTRIYFKRRPRR